MFQDADSLRAGPDLAEADRCYAARDWAAAVRHYDAVAADPARAAALREVDRQLVAPGAAGGQRQRAR